MARSLLVFGIIQTIITTIACGIGLWYWKKYLDDRLEFDEKKFKVDQQEAKRDRFEERYGKDVLVVDDEIEYIRYQSEYFNIITSLIVVPRLPKPTTKILERISLKQGFILLQDYISIIANPKVGIASHVYCSTNYNPPEWHAHDAFFTKDMIPITEVWSEEYLRTIEGDADTDLSEFHNRGIVANMMSFNGKNSAQISDADRKSLTYNCIMQANIFAKDTESIPLLNLYGKEAE